jgi:hypothetical protein
MCSFVTFYNAGVVTPDPSIGSWSKSYDYKI